MARLLLQCAGLEPQILELRLGANRIGRGPKNDFQIEHPTISATHCEVVLRADEVILRDCDSTNGTYLGGLLIREATLSAGQTFRAGDVEFLVESTEVKVAIPEVELPVEAPPVMLADGSMLCRRHPEAKVTHRCGHCHEVLCDQCVTRLRRRGGKVLKLCAVCSQPVDPITPEKKKKRSLLGILRKTVKLPFVRSQKVQR